MDGYGSINNIFTFGNQLYFWQDKAFGWVSVKEREILSATNTTNLVLGTGGILDRYDYLSTVNGCINNTAICNSDSTVYWFDGLTLLHFHLRPINHVVYMGPYSLRMGDLILKSASR